MPKNDRHSRVSGNPFLERVRLLDPRFRGDDDDRTFGVYVHVPYCTSLCPYCDFNSYVLPSRSEAVWETLLTAMLAELSARGRAFSDRTLASVYFGGGTPSLAPAWFFSRLLAAVRAKWSSRSETEVTVEANPGTIGAQGLAALREAGINRLSLGWQSTNDGILATLGRIHTSADNRRSFDEARRVGFDNLSLDLIFAVPGQSLMQLGRDLDLIEELGPEHVSAYALTYHQGTAFYRARAEGSLVPISEDQELAMMELMSSRLGAAGYEHYEVSNYARPGYRAIHNSLYWTGGEYLGLGPGAHSFCHDKWTRGWRWEGREEPAKYIEAWRGRPATGLPSAKDESLELFEDVTARQLFSERMLMGLRLREGVALDEPIVASHAEIVQAGSDEAVRRGWARVREGRLVPTDAGLLAADALAELFF